MLLPRMHIYRIAAGLYMNLQLFRRFRRETIIILHTARRPNPYINFSDACVFVCVCVCPSRMRFAISAPIVSPLGSFSSSLDKAHFPTTFLPRPRSRGSEKGQKL